MVRTVTGDHSAALDENSPEEDEESDTQAVLVTLDSVPDPSCACKVICSDMEPTATVCGLDTKTTCVTSAKAGRAGKNAKLMTSTVRNERSVWRVTEIYSYADKGGSFLCASCLAKVGFGTSSNLRRRCSGISLLCVSSSKPAGAVANFCLADESLCSAISPDGFFSALCNTSESAFRSSETCASPDLSPLAP